MKEKYIPVYGVVPIKDWDWKQCHTDLRKMNRKNPFEGYIKFDSGKLIGMFEYVFKKSSFKCFI